MVRSPYITIDHRDNFSEQGYIEPANCTPIVFKYSNYSNFLPSLFNFKIEYHNMYF